MRGTGFYLSALINGDPSGLEDDEYNEFCKWEKEAIKQVEGLQFHWACDDSDSYFGIDDVSGLLADVVDIKLVFKEKK